MIKKKKKNSRKFGFDKNAQTFFTLAPRKQIQ